MAQCLIVTYVRILIEVFGEEILIVIYMITVDEHTLICRYFYFLFERMVFGKDIFNMVSCLEVK